MRRIGEGGTWILFGLVVAAALSTFLPWHDPELPGSLQLTVLEGGGTMKTARAVRPLCEYLSQQLRRSVVPKVVTASELQEELAKARLFLLPASLLADSSRFTILARAKGPGLDAAYDRPYLLFPRGKRWFEMEKPRLILGDSWSWMGGKGAKEYLAAHGHTLEAGFSVVDAGHNVYDHEEAICAVVHGAYDLAVVRESDLRLAIEEGIIDPRRFGFGPAGPAGGGIVLAAAPSLSLSAQRSLRSAALNLDTFRFDNKHLPAALALSGLALVGIEGFVPDHPFPNLRP
jgi:ABC-type phosphate/phosphonate transport system substrate-binding protein